MADPRDARDRPARHEDERASGPAPRRKVVAGAAVIAGAVTAVLVGLTLSGDQPLVEGLPAALSNGLLLFFLVLGIEAVATGRGRPLTVALAAAGGTLATVLPVRLAAVAAGARGPFGSVADTVLDVAARSLAVLAVVGLTGRWAQSRPRR